MLLRSAIALTVLAAAAALVVVLGHRAGPDGRALFARACSACHSLDGRTTHQRAGGDLSAYRFATRDVVAFARVMPVRPRLSAAELDAVARYVTDRERAHRR